MYLLNSAGILHENPYTGDRIVKARLLHFSDLPASAATHSQKVEAREEQEQEQEQHQHAQEKIQIEQYTTIAIKYLHDSRQKYSADSDAEQSDNQDELNDDRERAPTRSPEGPITSAHSPWITRLQGLAQQGEALPQVQVHSRQPETLHFGIKARREIEALKAAQGHRHVVTLLGWTGHPLKKEVPQATPTTSEAVTTIPVHSRDERVQEREAPLNDSFLGAELAMALLPQRHQAAQPGLAMSLDAQPPTLFIAPPEFEQGGRFSDSDNDDGSYYGESDIDEDDGVVASSPSTTTRVVDIQDLDRYYRAQPRIGGILLPYMPLTLSDLIKSGWSKTRPRLVLTCMQQIFDGLDWIHEEAQYIHRDISAGNILVSTQGWMDWTLLVKDTESKEKMDQGVDRRVFCVISDFGCAVKDRRLDQLPPPSKPDLNGESVEDETQGDAGSRDHRQQQSNLYTFEVGTRNYRAPELLFSSQTYGTSVDMWSAGVLFAELFLGGPLFDADTDIGLICAIVKVLGSPTEQNWPEFPDMPDYGKLNFQAREVTPLSTLLLGDSCKVLASRGEEEKEGNEGHPPYTGPPTRASKSAVDVISKLVMYSGKQRLSAREALDLLRTNEAANSLTFAAAATPRTLAIGNVSRDNEQAEQRDGDDNDDHVDIPTIQQTLQEIRRRELEEDEEIGGCFGFGIGFGGDHSGSDGQDNDFYDDDDEQGDDEGWRGGGDNAPSMMPRYRPRHRQPFVSQTEWVSDEEF